MTLSCCSPFAPPAAAARIGALAALWMCGVVPAAPAQEPEPPPHQVWVGTTGHPFGDGTTAEGPLDGSSALKLDRVLTELYTRHGDYGEAVYLRFLPGHYETGGISLRPGWWVEGAGMGLTVLRRVPSDRDLRDRGSGFSVISGGWTGQEVPAGSPRPERDYVGVRVAHLTADANWAGLKAGLGPMVKKAAGVSLLCRSGEVAYVKVIHSGAWGGRESWREVFPISVSSMSSTPTGPPGYLDPQFEIHHCVVEGKVEGPEWAEQYPYGTAIIIGQRDSDPTRFPVSAHVHHNEIRNFSNGIGFGGAWVSTALFEHNTVTGCNGGFNFDTGGNNNVTIRYNLIEDCVSGGNLVNGRGFIIESNTFRMRYNVKGSLASINYALNIRDFTQSFQIRDNTIELPAGTEPSPGAQTGGIFARGQGVGYRYIQDPPGVYQLVIMRHVIENNPINPLLKNRLETTTAKGWLYAEVEGEEINLSGVQGVGDGATYVWPKP